MIIIRDVCHWAFLEHFQINFTLLPLFFLRQCFSVRMHCTVLCIAHKFHSRHLSSHICHKYFYHIIDLLVSSSLNWTNQNFSTFQSTVERIEFSFHCFSWTKIKVCDRNVQNWSLVVQHTTDSTSSTQYDDILLQHSSRRQPIDCLIFHFLHLLFSIYFNVLTRNFQTIPPDPSFFATISI